MNTALFGDTITVYNHYKAARVDYWQRTVISGVQYRTKTEKTVAADGLHVANIVSVTIPVDADAGGRHFIAPNAFSESASKDSYFTLEASQNQDFIVFGSVSKDISPTYTVGALKAEYGYTTIKAVSDNTLRPRLKHWKVTCE